MNLMEDLNFKTKYHKHKIRVKLWESNFMEKYGRKPNKNDIKVADITIREAYKMYWKLKTRALEETLTEITFDKDTTENFLSNSSSSRSIKYMEPQEDNHKNIIDKSLELVNNCAGNCVSEITTISGHIKNKTNMENTLNQINVKHDQTVFIERSSFQLSQNMCKSLKFSKRNPRKSGSFSKLNVQPLDLDLFSDQTIKSEINKNFKIQDVLKSTLNNDLKIIFDDKNILEQSTIQNLVKTCTVYNKQLNSDWLKRCIPQNSFENTLSEIDRLSQNNVCKSESLNSIESSEQNILTHSVLYNQSFTDDEDYICNSDSEEDRKNKRIRNLKKVVYENGLEPSKKLCITNNIYQQTKDTNKLLQNSVIDISKIRFLNNSSTLNFKNIYSINNNKFPKINNSERGIQLIEATQNISKTGIKSTSEKMSQKCLKKKCFNKILSSNIDIFTNNINNTKNQMAIKDITDVSSVLNPLNYHTNNFSINLRSNNEKRLGQNMSAEKLNENFIKVNLKKKIFVRGKKLFNISKYKKNQWKERKKQRNLHKTNVNVSDAIYINNNLLCYKCGELGHFARHCKNLKDCLLPNKNIDISSYPVLEEIAQLTELNAVESYNHSTTDVQCDNIPTLKSNIIVHSADYKNCQNPDILDNPKLIINKIHKNVLEKTRKVNPLYELELDYSVKDTPLEVLLALKKFGYNEFREGQEKAIMRILSGQSTLVVLATGFGKSLCYQLPAYMYAKKYACITLVISPLISLMNDQVSRMSNFLQAAYLHTNQSSKEQAKVLENLKKGKLNVLLISPEMIISGENLNNLRNIKDMLPPIAFACIDEVHCISQWSHNFRPSYLTVCKVLREKLGVEIILGLTATASNNTVMNIINFLNIKDGITGVILERSLPSNLYLTISHDQHKEEALIKLLQTERFKKCQSIIIYCTRREECTRVAKLLRMSLSNFRLKQFNSKTKISSIVEVYHAGLSSYRRKIIQFAFMKSEIRIIVATIAFGMGLNKSNIRAVIHFNMPASFEGYVQEIGRAGRDGSLAYCHLFLSTKKNFDEYELCRHINANGIDRYTIKRLLQRIFMPCSCTNSYTKLRCRGHEIGFSIEDTVKLLDISEEIITTLLCYLELHPKHFIKLLPSSFINTKIYSYNGPNQLKMALESSQTLKMVLALLKKNGAYDENSSTVKFSVIDIAAAIGLDSDVLKSQIKNLEWVTENDKTNRSTISVHFYTPGFRVIAFGDLANEELEEALESLSEQSQLHSAMSLQRLKSINSTMRKYSFTSVEECIDLNQETQFRCEELKNTIRKHFELNEFITNISDKSQVDLQNEDRIVADIRNLILSYRDITFTGRNVARIFHGIQSPNFSAVIWSRCRFWRSHLTDDFNVICQLADKEILKHKKM